MDDISFSLSPSSLAVCIDCDHLTAQEDFCHADRMLDFYVCDYVTHGAIYVTEDDNDIEVSAGQCLILDKGRRHYGKRAVLKGTQWYYIHFYIDEIPAAVTGRTAGIPKLFTPAGGIENGFMRLVQMYQSDGVSPAVNAELMKLLYSFGANKEKSLSDRIGDHLEDIWNERFAASELEHRFYLSYKYMAAVFRREKGMTMQEYHDTVKLRRCAALLRSTLMSISEISAAAGYSDPLYFSRRFHSYYGMSPSGYRKSIRGRM